MNDFDRLDQGQKQDLDNFLTPSLQGYQNQALSLPLKKPWRLNSQFWIAFFGGVLPLMVIAYLNGKRLHLSGKHLRLIIVVGIVALVVVGVQRVVLAAEERVPGRGHLAGALAGAVLAGRVGPARLQRGRGRARGTTASH